MRANWIVEVAYEDMDHPLLFGPWTMDVAKRTQVDLQQRLDSKLGYWVSVTAYPIRRASAASIAREFED